MNRQACVYIMSNRQNGTLYISVTSQLIKRVWQHKSARMPGFSQRHHTNLLVYYELSDSMYTAILRERQIKTWRRQWKIDLIESLNPQWTDLYETLLPSAISDEP